MCLCLCFSICIFLSFYFSLCLCLCLCLCFCLCLCLCRYLCKCIYSTNVYLYRTASYYYKWLLSHSSPLTATMSFSILYLFAQIVEDICGRDCLESGTHSKPLFFVSVSSVSVSLSVSVSISVSSHKFSEVFTNDRSKITYFTVALTPSQISDFTSVIGEDYVTVSIDVSISMSIYYHILHH